MSNPHERPAVSTDRYATALLKEDTGNTLEYGDVQEIETDLITIKYAPKMNSAKMYASGRAAESYIAKAGGTANVTVVGLTAEEEKEYFGSTLTTDGLLIENANDYVPDRMIIWSTLRSDGHYNLHKIMKAKFASQGEEVKTTDENGVTFTGTSLQADYIPLIHNGDIKFDRKNVDASTPEGKKTIDDWFATALGGIKLTGTEGDGVSASETAGGTPGIPTE